ncbi:MAG: hypothetical protein J7M11_04380 [Elusimicrobia bacterium]|nr:hypothetical protein [Elusimicrobiota bacterium]
MKNSFDKWMAEIKKVNGDNLVSIIRHGENRVLVLLRELNFNNLLENSKLVRKMQSKGTVPLYLTEEYINTSCDVYPLEYLRMKRTSRLIYGKNLLDKLEIPSENIRLESEQKIKGALIRITQVILESGKNMRRLRKTSFLALDDILAGLEGILELSGMSGQFSPAELIENAQQKFSIDLKPLKDVLDWKNGTKPGDFKKLVYDFYEKIEEIANFADRFNTDGQ